MNKNDFLALLYDRPVEVGHWVGFKDLTELHNGWLKAFLYDDTTDQTLQAHRGSYKTTTLSLFLALHVIERPYETTIFFRKTDTDVKEVIRQTSNILHTGCVNEIVKSIYNKPLALVMDSDSAIDTNLLNTVKGQPQILGLGIGTSITGKHADVVITDDIVNLKDRISSAERERTKIAYQELQNIKNRDGRFINTGTPWHKDDAFSLMPSPKKINCYESGLMTDEQIAYMREHLSPSLFAANYELKHIADGNALFGEPAQDLPAEMVRNGECQVDAAYDGEDFTAFTIMVYSNGRYYIYGRMWRKHVSDCYGDIVNLYSLFACGKMFLEKNADKGMVARDFKNLGVRAISYNEHMNKHIKISTYLKAIWPDVAFVEGTDPEYIAQICDYTEDAEHDDAPDSAAVLARRIYPRVARREGRRNVVSDVTSYDE